MVKCKDVRFKFMAERDGKLDHVSILFHHFGLDQLCTCRYHM